MTLQTAHLRIYTTDLAFYEGYLNRLVEEGVAGFPEAVRRLRDHVPRFANCSADDIDAGNPSVDDARLVFAREHDFEDWSGMVARLDAIRGGSHAEDYIGFIHAVEGGDADLVATCLDKDPDLVHSVASTHKTPLHSSGNKDIAALLLSRGADPELETCHAGGTALTHALIWGWSEMADTIAQYSRSPDNLRVAAGLGDLESLSEMFEADGSVTARGSSNRDYYRPNHGWYPWQPADDGQEVLDEALIYAAISGRIEAATEMLRLGANVNGYAYRTPPLLRAAWRGRLEMTQWLVDQGAKINATGWLGGHAKGVTALHLAAGNGDMDMIELLLNLGADPGLQDELYNGTPAGWANNFGQKAAEARLGPLSG